MRKILVTVTLAGAALVLGAAPAVAGGGNVKQFCKAWLAVDRATDGPSERQAQRALDTAPPDIVESVQTVFTLFQEQGEDAFGDPAFTDALAQVDAFAIDKCGYESIDVSMQDYAFSGVPDEVEKGKVAFTVTNDGAELHEFSVVRLKGDATLADLLEAESEEDLEDLATQVKGGAFATPGASDTAFYNLKKTGNYAALCSIPVGTTPESVEGDGEGGSGPPHFMEGMAAEFEVVK